MPIGSLLYFVIALFIPTSVCASIQMKVTHVNRTPCKRIGVGTPCMLHVTCNGTSNAFPAIEGLDTFRITGRSQSTIVVNGAPMVVYSYELHATKPGEYTIGPARATINGKQVISDTHRLTVISEREEAKERKKVEEAAGVLLRLETDDDDVVVGQRISGTLRLYMRSDYRSGEVYPEGIGIENWEGLPIVIGEQTQGTCTLDDVRYKYLEWEWEAVAQEPGTFVIPACYSSCRVLVQDRPTGLWANFPFLGSRYEQIRTYSNSLEITVESLPPCNHPVHGIGEFSSIEARISPLAARQGEGMELCIELTGAGTSKNISLQNMPEQLRWYDSKKSVKPSSNNEKDSIRSFEYIVQGMEPGNWQIPSQIFYYFDSKSRQYKQLKTAPLFLTIIPSATTTTHNQSEQKDQLEVPIASTADTSECQVTPLWESNYWQPASGQKIPWTIFWLVMSMPLCGIVVLFLLRALRHRKNSRSTAIGMRQAFNRARSSLKHAQRIHDLTRIYLIFIELYAAYMHVHPSDVTQERITQVLHEAGMSEEQISTWNKFFVHMTAMSYAGHQKYDETFFAQAMQWLDIMKQYLD